MQFARSLPKRDDDERILPLINIVFLLLIFFMLAGRLASSDPFKIEPAESRSEAPADIPELLVLVSADGQLALDGEVMDQPALKSALAEKLPKDGKAKPRVRLKADGGAQADKVVAVMEMLREAGVEKLTLLTIPLAP
jgi:biopolymer transport protein ExbD